MPSTFYFGKQFKNSCCSMPTRAGRTAQARTRQKFEDEYLAVPLRTSAKASRKVQYIGLGTTRAVLDAVCKVASIDCYTVSRGYVHLD
jgi:hypothetical protein